MRLFGTVIILALVIGWCSGSATSLKAADTITDVSWPNCTLREPPLGHHGIVGINGGLALRPNPCLAKQIGWFNRPSVYVNTGYPGPQRAMKFQHYPRNCSSRDERCLAYNYGYNSGLYDIKYASMQGVIADRWWLDVETENSWSDNTAVNRQALTGIKDAVSRYAGQGSIGFYSYPGQWDLITGQWHNGLPAWAATGSSLFDDARASCRQASFTGGKTMLAQYVPSLDQNITCR